MSDAGPGGAPSKWSLLRIAFKLSKKGDAKGAPPRASRASRRVHPAPRKKELSREDKAAIKIQAVWRGKMVRDELAFGWDDELAYGY